MTRSGGDSPFAGRSFLDLEAERAAAQYQADAESGRDADDQPFTGGSIHDLTAVRAQIEYDIERTRDPEVLARLRERLEAVSGEMRDLGLTGR